MSSAPKAKTAGMPDSHPLAAKRVAAAPADEVLRWLDSSEAGLSGTEAAARLARYGPNAVRTHQVSALAVLGRQLRNAVLMLLAGTAVVSYFLGDSMQAVIIGVILAASIGLGFINEYRAENAAAALHSRMRHTARRAPRRGVRRPRRHRPGARRCDPAVVGRGRPSRRAAARGERSGMQRKHPDRRIDELGEIAATGARRHGIGRIRRPGFHGHDRQRRRGHRRGVRHRTKCRIRPHRSGFG